MTWFKVDDALARHPKVKALRAKGARVRSDALAIWLLCGTECASVLGQGGVRDGFVSESDLEDIARPLVGAQLRAAVDALVGAGLWEPTDGGWLFHDWADHQPTSDSIKKRRETWRRHKRGQRGDSDAESDAASTSASTDVSTVDTPPDTTAESASESTEVSSPRAGARARSRPDPSRPDPIPKIQPGNDLGGSVASVSAPSDAFDRAFGFVLRTFQSAWEAHNRDAWPGAGKHRDRLDRIAREVAERPDGETWIAASVAGYFASSDSFVARVRWNFATWSSDPGRWISTRGEPVDADAASVMARVPTNVPTTITDDEMHAVLTARS